MINEDTIYLLRECNAGTQMAVYSIGEILENVKWRRSVIKRGERTVMPCKRR